MGVLESPGFFVSKRVGTLIKSFPYDSMMFLLSVVVSIVTTASLMEIVFFECDFSSLYSEMQWI